MPTFSYLIIAKTSGDRYAKVVSRGWTSEADALTERAELDDSGAYAWVDVVVETVST